MHDQITKILETINDNKWTLRPQTLYLLEQQYSRVSEHKDQWSLVHSKIGHRPHILETKEIMARKKIFWWPLLQTYKFSGKSKDEHSHQDADRMCR
jgi:hypothetical protein